MPLNNKKNKPKLERRNSILNVTTTQKENIDEVVDLATNSQHVGLYEQARSHGKPVMSSSYSNCLCVIIHDAEHQQGYLMHISPVRRGGLNQERLFRYVDQQILQSVNSFPAGTPIDILLWKGASFVPDEKNGLVESYADHLKGVVDNNVVVLDMMDKKNLGPEASILYNPKTGETFIVSGEHEPRVAEVITGMKSARAKAGEDRQLVARSLLFQPGSKAKVPESRDIQKRYR